MRAIGSGVVWTFALWAGCKAEMLRHPAMDANRPEGFDASPGGLVADAGRGPVFPPDAAVGPVFSDACWASSLPAPAQPIQPTDSVDAACAVGAAAVPADWSYPSSAGTDQDDRRYLVGRWASCDRSGIAGLPAHAGIEFGANGRWRLLDIDPGSGAYAPVPRSDTTSGYYYLLGIGQLDLRGELPGTVGAGLHVSFTDGMEVVDFDASTGQASVYVRVTPSPLNGADNPPPTAAGNCSMVGDWEVPSQSGVIDAVSSVFSFDAAGNFVVGPAGANLCDTHGGYGTYALSPGVFQLTTNVGLGACAWWYSASYQATFDASCEHLSLTRQYDNCTGGRAYFNSPTTLTRQ